MTLCLQYTPARAPIYRSREVSDSCLSAISRRRGADAIIFYSYMCIWCVGTYLQQKKKKKTVKKLLVFIIEHLQSAIQ